MWRKRMCNTSPVCGSKRPRPALVQNCAVHIHDRAVQLLGPQLSAVSDQGLSRKHLIGHWAAGGLVDLGSVILSCSS